MPHQHVISCLANGFPHDTQNHPPRVIYDPAPFGQTNTGGIAFQPDLSGALIVSRLAVTNQRSVADVPQHQVH